MNPEDRMAQSARDRAARIYNSLIEAVDEWKRADEEVRLAVEGFGSFSELSSRQKLRSEAVEKLARLVEFME